jgi:hypothetical protein
MLSSDEAFQCIDNLVLMQKTEAQKIILNVHKRSQDDNWLSDEMQWTLPQ